MRKTRPNKLERGAEVYCNGYLGRVLRMYTEDLVEVRVPGGEVCVDISELDIVYEDGCLLGEYRTCMNLHSYYS